jgi:hypothetical protein
MVRHDFTCGVCDHTGTYWAYASSPPEHCGQAMTWTPRPGSFAIDAKEPFHQFQTEIGGQMRNVGSLHDIRRIENEAEKRSRNGEGQPMVWRDYAQNSSNKDVHTLSSTPHKPIDGYAGEKKHGQTMQARPEKFKKRVGKAVTKDHGTV